MVTLAPQTAPLSCWAQAISYSDADFQLNVRIGNSGAAPISSPCVSLRFLRPGEITGSTGGTATSISSTVKKICLNGPLNPGQGVSVGVQGTYDDSFGEFSTPTCHISVP